MHAACPCGKLYFITVQAQNIANDMQVLPANKQRRIADQENGLVSAEQRYPYTPLPDAMDECSSRHRTTGTVVAVVVVQDSATTNVSLRECGTERHEQTEMESVVPKRLGLETKLMQTNDQQREIKSWMLSDELEDRRERSRHVNASAL